LLKLPEGIEPDMRCPRCLSRLSRHTIEMHCTNIECAMRYPVFDGVPVLIDDTKSLFSARDFEAGTVQYYRPLPGPVRALERVLPRISWNLSAAAN
jgi:hypothetical protein